MKDESFRLTPHDVRGQQFARVLRGYTPAEVDEFQMRVAEELDKLVRERVQLDERLKNAQEQLKSYRERERAVNEALVAAQQLRNDTRSQAERDAEGIVREARAEGERLVERARGDERDVRARAETAARQFAAYVAAFRGLLKRQLAELDVLEGHSRTIVEVEAQALERASREPASREPASDGAGAGEKSD